jgi:hypothetical protein
VVAKKDKLKAAFEAAEQINASLWHSAVDPQYMSVDEFHEHVTEHHGVAATIKVVDVETEHVFGFIERYNDGTTTIYIVKNLSLRWKRVVGTKELCQIVVDRQEDFSPDGQDTIQRLFASAVAIDLYAPENAALLSEYVAEVVAWELLYPHELRRADKARIDAGEITIADVATRLRLPSDIVSVVLSPPYLALCDKYWAEVEADKKKTRVV